MTNKLFLSTLALALVTPAIVAPIPTDAQVKQFTDVPNSHPYYQIIQEMQEKNIIHGYPDGTFKPTQTISRQHASVLVMRALEMNGLELQKEKTFVQPKDLPSTHPYYTEMKTLIEAGLLEADQNGKIFPDKPLTRGEMAKILAVAFNLKTNTDFAFRDVVNTEFEEYVKALYSNGVTTGYEDGTFKPNESLTRAHYALFMYRSMNKDNTTSQQPNEITTPETNTTTPTNQQEVETPSKASTDNVSLTVSEFEKKVVELTNVEREKMGLDPLQMYMPLMESARAKSEDMAKNQYFSHESPTFGDPFEQMEAAGIDYYYAGENIALGYRTPEAVVEGWMNSPGHRANILTPEYSHIGVGFSEDGYYWTQQFIQLREK